MQKKDKEMHLRTEKPFQKWVNNTLQAMQKFKHWWQCITTNLWPASWLSVQLVMTVNKKPVHTEGNKRQTCTAGLPVALKSKNPKQNQTSKWHFHMLYMLFVVLKPSSKSDLPTWNALLVLLGNSCSILLCEFRFTGVFQSNKCPHILIHPFRWCSAIKPLSPSQWHSLLMKYKISKVQQKWTSKWISDIKTLKIVLVFCIPYRFCLRNKGQCIARRPKWNSWENTGRCN